MIQPVMQIDSLSHIPSYSENNSNKNISNQAAATKLVKAKSMLYQKSMQNNPWAANFIFMAEAALKNGNSAAADNFTSRAMQIINPINDVETNLAPPVDNNPQIIDKPEHTEHNYHDVSSDPGVSFSSPAKLTGPQSFIAVPAHEAQHISRRISEAVLSGDRIYVSVSYKIRYDPNTGEAYMAGGTTRTIKFSQYEKAENTPGSLIDLYA